MGSARFHGLYLYCIIRISRILRKITYSVPRGVSVSAW